MRGETDERVDRPEGGDRPEGETDLRGDRLKVVQSQ